MRDLFREGLKLGESLARLPWEAARRVTGGRSETLDRAADLGERLGTLPFRAARRVLGEEGSSATRQSPAGTGSAGRVKVRRAPEARVVVVGAGYAGLSCFLELQDHLSRQYDLVLVNGDRYHWFTTELHTYAAGEQADAVRIPLSRVVARPGRLVVDRVTAIDRQARKVQLASGEHLAYDLLVFALGSDPEYFGLPGVAEHSLILGNWQGATHLREQIAAALSRQDEVRHVVVAGGGLTGVEVVGELADEYGQRVKLTLVEAGPEIMAGFAPDLVRTAHEVLEGKGIQIRTGNPIARVDDRQITFKDGEQMSFDLLVWAGGVRGSAILAQSGFTVTPRGRGKVDPFLRAAGQSEVYLVGDSAAFLDPGTGREVPPTAQAAVQMGRAAGQNILRRLRGQAEQPFLPQMKGSFASLGRAEGVGQIGKEQFTGASAMLIKHAIEAHHAWETGAGVMPLISRLLQAPRRFFRGRPGARPKPRVAAAAARPEPRAR